MSALAEKYRKFNVAVVSGLDGAIKSDGSTPERVRDDGRALILCDGTDS